MKSECASGGLWNAPVTWLHSVLPNYKTERTIEGGCALSLLTLWNQQVKEREVDHDTNKKPASLASHTPPSSGPSPCLAFCCSPTSTSAIVVSNKNGETLARRHALAHQPVYCDHRDDTTTVSPPNTTIRRRRPVGLDHLVLPSIRRVGTSVAAGSTTTAAEHCGPRGAFLGGRQSRTRDPMDVRL